MFRTPILTALFLLAGQGLRAQGQEDTLRLKEVEVTAPRLAEFASGSKVLRMDSATMARYRAANLADLLANESPIFIKSYGLGSLAITAFRGGSASHTAILWNGFNIGSPMNGMIDLSLIPVAVANTVSLQYGGSSALWGSGAVGGTVHLNNAVQFGRGLTVDAGVSFGSFGDRRQHARVEVGKARWVSAVSVFNTTARNDFEYVNTVFARALEQRQRHAELKQYGLLVENHFRITKRQRINVLFWYQNNDRNIPPTLLQELSSARQQDMTYRLTAEWQRSGEKVNTHVRAAYFDEELLWHDRMNDTAAFSRSQNVIVEGELRVKLTANQVVNAGINNTFAQATSAGYPDRRQQNRTALFASYQLNTTDRRSRTTLSFRQELVEEELVPFTFSLGSEFAFNKAISAKGNVAKVYRIPTFNDLYWIPGGDPGLLPESGYSAEVGLAAKWSPTGSRLSLTGEVTGFHRTMDNWIIWLPGAAYWGPRNVMEVWSRGFETQGDVAVRMNKVQVKLGATTSYVLSTNEVAKSANDASVDKQLIYVPMYSGGGKLSVIYRNFSATYAMNYTGYRYTSTDNRDFLVPYTLANASVSYKLPVGGRYTLSLLAQGFNLFDERYEVVQSRPMPLRNYQFGITVQFNRPCRPIPATP